MAHFLRSPRIKARANSLANLSGYSAANSLHDGSAKLHTADCNHHKHLPSEPRAVLQAIFRIRICGASGGARPKRQRSRVMDCAPCDGHHLQVAWQAEQPRFSTMQSNTKQGGCCGHRNVIVGVFCACGPACPRAWTCFCMVYQTWLPAPSPCQQVTAKNIHHTSARVIEISQLGHFGSGACRPGVTMSCAMGRAASPSIS